MPLRTPAWIALGFLAGALSVLTFHAAMWEALHLMSLPGLRMPAPYPMNPTQPFGVPAIVSLCFWGGLYGAVFGLVAPRIDLPLPATGFLLGIVAVLVGATVVAALKHQQLFEDGSLNNWARDLLVNCFWGIGVGVILSLLTRRARVRS